MKILILLLLNICIIFGTHEHVQLFIEQPPGRCYYLSSLPPSPPLSRLPSRSPFSNEIKHAGADLNPLLGLNILNIPGVDMKSTTWIEHLRSGYKIHSLD